MKTFLAILTAVMVTAFAPVAQARDHHRHSYRHHHHHHSGWSLSVGPRLYGGDYYYSRPRYYCPPPAYSYYSPAPYYYYNRPYVRYYRW